MFEQPLFLFLETVLKVHSGLIFSVYYSWSNG